MAVQGLLAAAGEEAVAVVELQLGAAPRLTVGGHQDMIECSLVVDVVADIAACRVPYYYDQQAVVLVDRTVVLPFPFFVVVPFPFHQLHLYLHVHHLPRLLLRLVASSAD